MFKVKLYKYDSSQEANGYRGVGENDFSRFVAQGQDIGEDITQVLDTSEITIYGLPFEKAFDPETKFIADIVEYTDVDPETIVHTVHLVVSRDTPNQPILSDPNYWDHHISFVEPSVIAQKRLVDNIASTYKLKDVTLEERPAFPDTSVTLNIESSAYTPSENFGYVFDNSGGGLLQKVERYINKTGKYFQLENQLQIVNRNGQSFTSIYNNIDKFEANGKYYARFNIPRLAIYLGVDNSRNFTKVGYASIDYTIQEFALNDEYNPINSYSGTFISNSNLGSGRYDSTTNWRNIIDGEWLLENTEGHRPLNPNIEQIYSYFKKYTQKSAPTIASFLSQEIEIKPDRKYVVSISLHQFNDSIPSNSGSYFRFTGSQPSYFVKTEKKYTGNVLSGEVIESVTPTTNYMTNRKTSGSGSFITYDVDTGKLVFASATPYSALALLQKAILNSALYEKQEGVYIADVNNSNLPFYIDDDFIDELSATLIIENFYNQKNLWEIMVEVGNYIHSIPEIKFGSDDRFVITFNRLGITEDDMEQKLGGKIGYENKQKSATTLSIYNSRSVEDYISATSSYITNMVQLGGYVEEWVVPKTTSEQLLVSNDTAEILVSKPIIELLNITVRANKTLNFNGNTIAEGTTRDLTDYVFEENVYKTLNIDYQLVPNRGISLYYKLGTNVITGGDYQLPQANTNIYTDYAIKKAIYSAFLGYPAVAPAPVTGYWTDLKVNDFSFFVRYRTKDSVRQNHIRPDLRKYLLNTKWDRYPEHNQFNNQTDVVVDSIKFGNQMFGKLIKTGNNSYDVYEWNDKWANVKHKGELYRLKGELYYVAKVMHTVYHSFIISKVSYSKDYNELSNIIGIPSEPRFYEISEQSLIWREFEVNDVVLLTDNEDQIEYKSNYVFNYDHLADLVIGEGTDFAKYAVTVFKGDKDAGQYDQTVGQRDLYKEVISPINAYSSENTLTYEYDMEDNYSAGNKVISTEKQAYNSLWAVQYTDIYGKATLLDFYILGSIGTPNPTEIMAFPESPIGTKNPSASNFIGNYDILATNVKDFNTDFNGRGIGLLKDCREAMSINYNLRMATSSDTFVLSPYVYLPKKSNIRVVLLAEEVNKLSSGYIDNSKIITPYDKQGNPMNPYFEFIIDKTTAFNSWDASKTVVTKFGVDLASIFENVADEHFTNTDGYQRVKSIAILCDVSLDAGLETENPVLPYKTQFIVARNIPADFTRKQALKKWSWGSPNKDQVFKNKQ